MKLTLKVKEQTIPIFLIRMKVEQNDSGSVIQVASAR